MVTDFLSKFLTERVEPKMIFGTKVKTMYEDGVGKTFTAKEFRTKIGMSDTTMRRMFRGDVSDDAMNEIAELLDLNLTEMLTVQPSFVCSLCKRKALSDGKFAIMLLMLAATVYACIEAIITGEPHFHLITIAFICFALHNVSNVWTVLQFSDKDQRIIEHSKYVGLILLVLAIVVSIF